MTNRNPPTSSIPPTSSASPISPLVYLDYNATTPVDPRVMEVMVPYFTESYGNASSASHPFGWIAKEGVDLARGQIAEAFGCHAREIVFTSGATESCNLAIRGVAKAYAGKGRHLITVPTEHRAVLDTHEALEQDGFEVSLLSVDRMGRVDPAQLAETIRDDTVLVSIMWANNETGTIQPMEAISEIARSRGVLFFSDATQAVGKLPVTVDAVDLMAFSGHKVYGPKGVGGLYVRRRNPRVRLWPQSTGGGQEDGRRAGTLNSPGIVGLGSAVAFAVGEREEEMTRMGEMRDRFEDTLKARIPEIKVNGDPDHRLPSTSSIVIPGVRSADLFTKLRNLAISSGSACSSASSKPSHVLKAMGLDDDEAFTTIRVGFGRFSANEHVDFAVDEIVAGVEKTRLPSSRS